MNAPRNLNWNVTGTEKKGLMCFKGGKNILNDLIYGLKNADLDYVNMMESEEANKTSTALYGQNISFRSLTI